MMGPPKNNPEELSEPPKDVTTASSNRASDSRQDIARRFLDDENVKGASREQKVEFLKSKDLTDKEIEDLLREEPAAQIPSTEAVLSETSSIEEPQQQDLPSIDRPPIVTYPEFFTGRSKPPTLLIPSTLLTTLSSLAGFATLLYGTDKHLLHPMLESQTSARQDYYASVSSALSSLVSKLEESVSVLPPSYRHKTDDRSGTESDDDDDPSELFHRDIGTQTSPDPFCMSNSLTTPHETDPGNVIQTQTATLRKVTYSLDSLRDGIEGHASAVQQAKTRVELLKDSVREVDRKAQDLKTTTNQAAAGYTPYSGWSSGGSGGEPDDEIRKAREILRGMKGVVLSRAMGPLTSRPVGR